MNTDVIKQNVLKLQNANATPEDIETYVRSAAQEMGHVAPTAQPSSPMTGPSAPDDGNFLQRSIKAPLSNLIATPATRVAQLATEGMGYLTGNDKLKDSGQQDVTYPIPLLGNLTVPGQKPFGQGGGKQIAGNALNTAAYLLPYKGISTSVEGAASKALPSFLSKIVGGSAAGATGGYLADVGNKLQQGQKTSQTVKPGIGTAVGASIPIIGEALKRVGRLAGESEGVITGAGYGNIKQAYNAGQQGGAAQQGFREGISGNTSPESLIDEAKGALDTMKSNRSTEYQQSLGSLKQNTASLDVSPIHQELQDQLNKFGVNVDQEGKLDFSRSPVRFDPEAQKTIGTIYGEMQQFGTSVGDRTTEGIDSLKRAFSSLYSPNSEVRSFVASMRGSVRDVLSNVNGYDEMANNYTGKTQIIDDIQKGLSLGGKAGVDTAFKKITSALRNNNDFRKEFIQELDNVSGGSLASKVAGSQLSSIMPKGIVGPIEGAGSIAAIAHGASMLPLLKLAVFASPRIVGEMVNALGVSSRYASQLQSLLTPSIVAGRGALPGILPQNKK